MVNQIIIAVVFFVVGFMLGWVSRDKLDGRFEKLNQSFFVSVIITLLYSASVVAEIVNPVYHTPPYLHGIMGIVAGYFFKRGIEK